MSRSGEVNPDLVGASGHEAAADYRKVIIERGQHLDLGTGGPAVVVALETPSVVEIAGYWSVDREGTGRRVTLDDSQVESFDPAVTPGVGELRQRVRGAGKEHRAARHAVEAVNQA